MENKTVLIIGMARSGIQAAPVLKSLGYNVILNDLKKYEELEGIECLNKNDYEFRLGEKPDELVDKADLIVVSPSVPLSLPYAEKAKAQGKEVIAEIEQAFRLCAGTTVAITGTNGKTTTTTLTGEIFKAANKGCYVVGNIGEPYIAHSLEAKKEDFMVCEISSYQLEGIKDYHPKTAALLNITEDHMIRHKTMENYINAKLRVFENQTKDDFSILNYDDETVRNLKNRVQGKPVFFSRKTVLEEGAYVENGNIVFNYNGKKETIIAVSDIMIKGQHNLENALAAVLLTMLAGVDKESVKKALETFTGVEHRIETVRTVDGVTYINDSKGTNPDSTIKAIETMTKPTVLILGGYDKGGSFDSLFEAFTDNIKHTVFIGVTRNMLEETAKKYNWQNYTNVSGSFEDGIIQAKKMAKEGYNVLLSPACASFDMFKDFEQRGEVFKQIVSQF
ncbi:MAG: UDP-N-acetylmuramoyl-L-alanine--D-glutamate ligase [Clostridiales bacterium]|nr:UDP-N-acetylmuramoyl-L-alanine--D-glutamate ligase [Clostridiales bacterium]